MSHEAHCTTNHRLFDCLWIFCPSQQQSNKTPHYLAGLERVGNAESIQISWRDHAVCQYTSDFEPRPWTAFFLGSCYEHIKFGFVDEKMACVRGHSSLLRSPYVAKKNKKNIFYFVTRLMQDTPRYIAQRHSMCIIIFIRLGYKC